MLEFLVFATGARRVLELGTYSGYSSISMAAALPPDGHIDTCEISPEHAAVAQRYIEAAGYDDRITVHVGPAQAAIERLDGDFDLVFIDADKVNYVNYYEAVLPRLADGGLIAADNTSERPRRRREQRRREHLGDPWVQRPRALRPARRLRDADRARRDHADPPRRVTANHVLLIVVAVFAVAILTPAALITARSSARTTTVLRTRTPCSRRRSRRASSIGYEAVGGRRYIADAATSRLVPWPAARDSVSVRVGQGGRSPPHRPPAGNHADRVRHADLPVAHGVRRGLRLVHRHERLALGAEGLASPSSAAARTAPAQRRLLVRALDAPPPRPAPSMRNVGTELGILMSKTRTEPLRKDLRAACVHEQGRVPGRQEPRRRRRGAGRQRLPRQVQQLFAVLVAEAPKREPLGSRLQCLDIDAHFAASARRAGPNAVRYERAGAPGPRPR